MDIKNGFLEYTLNNRKRTLVFSENAENQDLKIVYRKISQNGGQRITIKIVPECSIEIKKLFLEVSDAAGEKNTVFLNGYQTWTDSREFKMNEKIPKLNRLVWPIMSMYGDYTLTDINQGKLHSWTYTYIRDGEEIELIGSLSEASGYTLFEYLDGGKLRIVKDCSGLQMDEEYQGFDLLIIKGEENNAFEKYFDAMDLPKPRVKNCAGWTSWYNYYTGITEEIILDNLNAFKSKNVPIEIFQIDDGYQEAIGDWLEVNKKFPKGMKFIADEIKGCGYKAGIWLAPFICDKKSRIYREHREWVLKKAGFNPGWNGNFYLLDFYNEEVRRYLKEVFRVVFEDWGYEMVKLDFLYAAALTKRRDKTHGQIMYEAMNFLRELAGDKIILGCGVPLGCSFGLVDYCRIGSDVALKWEDELLKHLHYRERVSTINSLTSTIGRRHLNGRAFLNDPDVFIIREKGTELTKNQRYTLLLLNLIFGGLVFTSDNISEYSEEEMDLYRSIFPFKDKTIHRVTNNGVLRAYFSIDDRSYVSISNLNDKAITVELDDKDYYCRELGAVQRGTSVSLEAYQSLCLVETKSAAEGYQDNNIFMF